MQLTAEQRAEVLAIAAANGGAIAAAVVVEKAKKHSSTLRSLVGWDRDDSEMAYEARMERARLVIAAVKFKASEAESALSGAVEQSKLVAMAAQFKKLEAAGARRFVSVESDRKVGDGYRDVAAMTTSHGGRGIIRGQIVRELDTFIATRVALVPEFKPAFQQLRAQLLAMGNVVMPED